MHVLVTGAAGFIGSHVVEALSARGDDVVALDCLLPDSYDAAVKRATWTLLGELPGVGCVEADLRTADLTSLLDGVDGVIHEAAMPGLMPSWDRFATYLSCNVAGTERLVRAATEAGVERFVHASTSSVYGRFATGGEDQPTEPYSPYGVTKLAAEKLVLAYAANFGLPAVVLRYFSVYGPRQRPDMAYHRFCEALLDGRPVTVYGDGSQTRANTYVTDCAAVTVAALTAEAGERVYDVSGGRKLALVEALEVLADELGVTPRIEFEPTRPGDQQDTWSDAALAARDLGFDPAVPVEAGLRAQAAWHRDRRGR